MVGVPELGVGQGVGGLGDVNGGAGGEGLGAGEGGDGAAIGVEEVGLEDAGFGIGAVIAELGLDIDGGGLGGDFGGGHEGAVPGDVEGVGEDEADVAVDAAAEDVFAGAGGELGVPEVVDADGDDVVAGGDGGGDIQGKASVAAAVDADGAAVEGDFGDLKGAIEFQGDTFAGPVGGDGEVFAIPAVAGVEPGGFEVGHAEGVGQADGGPGGVVKGGGIGTGMVADLEFPVAIEIEGLAGGIGSDEPKGECQDGGEEQQFFH